MSIKTRMRTLLLCLPLLLGAFAGMPMRPEEVEELMQSMNEQKISYVVQADGRSDDPVIPQLPELPKLTDSPKRMEEEP